LLSLNQRVQGSSPWGLTKAEFKGGRNYRPPFSVQATHPFELYPTLNDIEHRRTKVRSPRTNGFVERFHGAVQEEFLKPALWTRFYPTQEAL
jgi:transposase InsO family protein